VNHDPHFVPQLRSDVVRQDHGLEAVLWAPDQSAPVALDPVATVMLGVIDGSASTSELARDVEEVVGLPADTAHAQVQRIVDQLHGGGLLIGSAPDPAPAAMPRGLFANPVSTCMETSSCTGRVTPVNLSIGGRELRVACQSDRVARRLRAAMREHVIDDQVSLGFMLRSPRRRLRTHVLVDRCGFAIGTAHGSRQAIATLVSHLSALLPVPDGRVRLRLRALVRDGQATLCQWPLVFLPPLDEARLAAAGYAVLDRLAVDLDVKTGAIINVPPPWASTGGAAPGHLGATAEPLAVDRLLVAAPGGSVLPGPAQLVADLAGEALAGAPADVLAACGAIVGSARAELVDPHGGAAVYYDRLAGRPGGQAGTPVG
jgi:Coenzyme PQQ synthesis protein D (PqqD)